MDNPRHLIIGGDSTLGQAIAARLSGTVLSTSRRPGGDLPLDLAQDPGAWPLPPDLDTAFFCAAVTRLADCRQNPTASRRINTDHPAALAHRLADRGVRIVLLSTNHVFAGDQSKPSPQSPTRAQSIYGQQKADAEAAFPSNTTIVRLTKVLSPHPTPLAAWRDALRHGQAVTALTDMVFSPVTLDHAAHAITQATLTPPGITHVSGDRDISYFDAARHIATRLNVRLTQVLPNRINDLGLPPEEAPAHSALGCLAPPNVFQTLDTALLL